MSNEESQNSDPRFLKRCSNCRFYEITIGAMSGNCHDPLMNNVGVYRNGCCGQWQEQSVKGEGI